jgi:hypothetical protein
MRHRKTSCLSFYVMGIVIRHSPVFVYRSPAVAGGLPYFGVLTLIMVIDRLHGKINLLGEVLQNAVYDLSL